MLLTLVAFVALGALTALGGCGSSTNGDLGVASFTVKGCGGSFSDIAGCDIKQLIATGGKIDMRALRLSDNSPLQLRSDFPTVISVTDLGAATYTLSALRPGKAMIVASNGSSDVDHVSMQVDDAIEAEAQAQAICMQTKDYGRAYRAFVAKERPGFQGD